MTKKYEIMWVDIDFKKLCEQMRDRGETRSLRESSKKIADGLKGLQVKRKSEKIIEDDWDILMPF